MPVEEEEKLERKEPLPATRTMPQNYSEFFMRYVLWIAGLVLLIFLLASVPINNKILLSQNQLLQGLLLIALVFVVIPQMVFWKRKAARLTEIEPLNPLKEKPHFEQQFREAGYDIQVLEAIPEPFEGTGSDQPFTTHFLAERQFPDGTRKPFIFRTGNLTRIPIGWIHRFYFENRSYSAAGTRKRIYEPLGPKVERPALKPAQTIVKVAIPKAGVGKEKEEAEEEESE